MSYTFIIDTNEYAGNFEREMFCHITGMPDCPAESTTSFDCSEAVVAAVKAGIRFDTLIEDRTCEHDGNYWERHCEIVPTPGWFNDGIGNHFRDTPENHRATGKKYPAYQSVAIFLSRKPSVFELVYMKIRAFGFSMLTKEHTWDRRPKVLGFRLVKSFVVEEEIVI